MLVSLDIPVSISVPTLVIELGIFLLTLILMERLVFDPIRHAWEDRDRRIQEGLAASTEGRDEAEQAREEVNRILREARTQAQHLIDQATTAGSQERDRLVTRATDEFRKLLDQARGQIAAERDRSAGELQKRLVDIALLAAAQVSGETFNQPAVRELAATVIDREGLR